MCAERRNKRRMIDEALEEVEAPDNSITVVASPTREEKSIWHRYSSRQRDVAEAERVRRERQLALAMS